MREADKGRFMAVIRTLCRRYEVDGKPRPVPCREVLAEYFEALRDIPIEDIEGGGEWHWGHGEFYPDRPATLRKSAEAWRTANPRPVEATSSTLPAWIHEAPGPRNPEFSAAMVALFEDLTAGQITVEEHMARLREICSTAGVPCDC